jgi:hypothetical protein
MGGQNSSHQKRELTIETLQSYCTLYHFPLAVTQIVWTYAQKPWALQYHVPRQMGVSTLSKACPLEYYNITNQCLGYKRDPKESHFANACGDFFSGWNSHMLLYRRFFAEFTSGEWEQRDTMRRHLARMVLRDSYPLPPNQYYVNVSSRFDTFVFFGIQDHCIRAIVRIETDPEVSRITDYLVLYSFKSRTLLQTQNTYDLLFWEPAANGNNANSLWGPTERSSVNNGYTIEFMSLGFSDRKAFGNVHHATLYIPPNLGFGKVKEMYGLPGKGIFLVDDAGQCTIALAAEEIKAVK